MPVITLSDLPPHELIPGYHGRFIHTEHNSFVYWSVRAGASFPEHSHSNDQIAHVLAGEFELVIDGLKTKLVPGVVAVIPPHVKHSGVAITDCQLLDVFYPAREDYRQKSEGQNEV